MNERDALELMERVLVHALDASMPGAPSEKLLRGRQRLEQALGRVRAELAQEDDVGALATSADERLAALLDRLDERGLRTDVERQLVDELEVARDVLASLLEYEAAPFGVEVPDELPPDL